MSESQKDFQHREKIMPVLNGELTEQPLACSVSTRRTDIDENHSSSLHHGVEVITSSADIMLPFMGEVVLPWIKG